MKRFTVVILALALVGLAGVSMAQSDNHQVQVSVASVAKLDVSDAAVTFSLDAVVGEDYTMPAADGTSTLSWSHNQGTNQEITVAAVKAVGNPANDINLEVTYGGVGGATVTIVSDGTDGSGVVKDNFGKGKEKDQTLTYEITNADIEDTPEGNYSWTVTYTIQDNS